MAVLSRDEILQAVDIKKELVEVPEWGGSVWVRGMTGADRDRFESSVIEMRGSKQTLHLDDMRAKLCSACICDEEGKLLFTPADVKALSAKSATALNRVFAIAQRLSGIGEEEVAELQEGLKSPFEDSASG